MEVWGVNEVMEFTGLSRKATVRILNESDAPVLPRKKNETFRIPKEAFIEWFKGGKYEAV